ncbi:N-acetyltransferase [Rheinheimera sp. MMS21-TC3]|uniref:GNAT family N-acetyltransferase n=1 Tax=Rheinheimera sp. MMS21-TC3 TaxID=3072790 RepID=UPI0028C49D35|nr:N-acetyltransferase [Rheinheimera sp. MMS21-TC3]WNO62054.1 N-acetyltransferase [Rheinheimera sp. MMS21-TC3]
MTLLHNISKTLQRRRNITWHSLGYDTHVRPETAQDWPDVAALTKAVFNADEEAKLNDKLRQQAANYISLVAEQHGKIVGHIMFSPVQLANAKQIKMMALAPMVVSKVLQQHGIGSALVRAGLEACYQQGVAAVVVLGHADYYPKFGFTPASNFAISCPWQVADEVFMLLELKANAMKNASGTVQYLPAFEQV